MPQLDYSSYTAQLFWLAISFSLMYLFVRNWFIPRIKQSLDSRKQAINKLISEAKDLKIMAEANQKKYLEELKKLHADIHAVNLETEAFCTAHYESEETKLNLKLNEEKKIFFEDLSKEQQSLESRLQDIATHLSKLILESIVKNDLNKEELNKSIQKIDFNKYYNN